MGTLEICLMRHSIVDLNYVLCIELTVDSIHWDVLLHRLECHSAGWSATLLTGVPLYRLECHSAGWSATLPTGVPLYRLECHSTDWSATLLAGVPLYRLECHSTDWSATLPTGVPLECHYSILSVTNEHGWH